MRLPDGQGGILFGPLMIPTASGQVTVRVSGFLRVNVNPNGNRSYSFSGGRRLAFAPTSGGILNEAPRGFEGSASAWGPLPGPDEVLAFVMPPIEVPSGWPAVPDQFSVRMRIKPVQ